ncbi:hypothetical protein [Arundinibacter roseus]|uniref:Lipoprotein n=1 Tax=Arundinibacter roseus TaxID=2070510 RepID=A0A4R4KMJ8_9BACT|nr:hypothetical protein [Arundinibacter roseus]TDB68222.1 hypothetical protein EZE20_04685 [Arundinibacter roseus]
MIKFEVKKWIALFLLFGVAAGCSSTKTVPYTSKWNAPFTYVDEAAPDQQDPRSRLRYGVINDDSFLYITLKTRDPRTVENILTSGLRLSFTPHTKPRSSFSLLFPVVSRDDRRALRKMDIDLPTSLGLSRMLEAFNKEALWKDRAGERFVNLVTTETGMRCTISLDENQELTQQYTIPFALLGVDARQASVLDIGIKTEGTSGQSGVSPRISVGMGGMGGFGMGGGGVGIGMGNGNRTVDDRAVDIRLQVALAKNSFSQDLR